MQLSFTMALLKLASYYYDMMSSSLQMSPHRSSYSTLLSSYLHISVSAQGSQYCQKRLSLIRQFLNYKRLRPVTMFAQYSQQTEAYSFILDTLNQERHWVIWVTWLLMRDNNRYFYDYYRLEGLSYQFTDQTAIFFYTQAYFLGLKKFFIIYCYFLAFYSLALYLFCLYVYLAILSAYLASLYAYRASLSLYLSRSFSSFSLSLASLYFYRAVLQSYFTLSFSSFYLCSSFCLATFYNLFASYYLFFSSFQFYLTSLSLSISYFDLRVFLFLLSFSSMILPFSTLSSSSLFYFTPPSFFWLSELLDYEAVWYF